DPVRLAGGDQHGFQPAPDPDQGHDIAVPVLWRLLDAGAGARHGNDAGADPAPARRERIVSPVFVLAAGGTGGHLFPAEALARELVRQGGAVHLATDRCADAFAEKVPGVAVCQVRAGRVGGGPLRIAYGVADMAGGIVHARRWLRPLAPGV